MAKITYLLGAGASANTIPIVADMHKRIEEVYELFQNKRHTIKMDAQLNNKLNNTATGYVQIMKEIAGELKWLVDEAGEYYSIDTLAKKYYLTNNGKYNRLKSCLILYLILEQYLFLPSEPKVEKEYNFKKQPVEKRYSSFIATIAKKSIAGLSLNENIKILSWNYDQQIELSLHSFSDNTIHNIKQAYNIHPNNISSDSGIPASAINKFEVIKLNGNATWDFLEAEGNWLTIFDNKLNNTDRLETFIEYYQNNKRNLDRNRQYFNFSWEALDDTHRENYNKYKDIMTEAENVAAETTILVVIGYSFPIFNREMDNRLFKKMEKLEKVYIQDKEPENIELILKNAFEIFQKTKNIKVNDFGINKLKEVPAISFHGVKNTNQFVIPYELTSD